MEQIIISSAATKKAKTSSIHFTFSTLPQRLSLFENNFLSSQPRLLEPPVEPSGSCVLGPAPRTKLARNSKVWPFSFKKRSNAWGDWLENRSRTKYYTQQKLRAETVAKISPKNKSKNKTKSLQTTTQSDTAPRMAWGTDFHTTRQKTKARPASFLSSSLQGCVAWDSRAPRPRPRRSGPRAASRAASRVG